MAKDIKVKIKKVSPDAVIPQYATSGSACFDLTSVEDIYVEAQQNKAVGTGLVFEVPDGYKLSILPRSGISLKTPLMVANSPGCCDSDFRGEVKVIIRNNSQMYQLTKPNNQYFTVDGRTETMSKEEMKEQGYSQSIPWPTFKIKKGERIAQGCIEVVQKATFEVVEEVSETDRGEGGMGSTGIK